MKEKLLDLLACPVCGGDLVLVHVGTREEKEIIEGLLSCKKCDREYKILRGVPRFADLSKIEEDKAETAENFGWQWTHFTQEDEKYNEQFLGWIQPVKPEFFQGKIILEGGCGKGRHTSLAANWGAQEVVGIDLSAAVESAFQATRALPNAHIVQADIFKLPYGSNNFEFCNFCFADGQFTNPSQTLEEMIQSSIENMTADLNMPIERATELANSFIPTLRRWRKN